MDQYVREYWKEAQNLFKYKLHEYLIEQGLMWNNEVLRNDLVEHWHGVLLNK